MNFRNARRWAMTILASATVAGCIGVGWGTTMTAHAATTGLGPYPGPTTNVCITGDVWVGTDANAPIMCWGVAECHDLATLPELNGCPVVVEPATPSTPTPVPTPKLVPVFPGEHIGDKVVHIVPTPPADHPDDAIFWNGHWWSY